VPLPSVFLFFLFCRARVRLPKSRFGKSPPAYRGRGPARPRSSGRGGPALGKSNHEQWTSALGGAGVFSEESIFFFKN